MAVDIKQICDYSDKLRNVSYILTETVGTTTSYTFPEDTLLPYIKRNLKEYIINHWDDEEIKKMVEALKKQAKVEMEEGWVGAISIPEGDGVDINAVKEAIVAYALNQMESSDLEPLQNLIVKDGYSKGQLKGHLFPDVLPAFKKWTAEGKKIYMYSSGLEFSQKCLISNSIEGDITELISGCFNSSEFPRTKSESFREMCKKVDCDADKVAFLTDNAPTARAARKAGLVVIMLCREGNSYMGNCVRESFPVITSFEDISQQICSKRKKSSDETENSGGKKAKLEDIPTEPKAKVAENKCEETVEKDLVPSETEPKKGSKDFESSENKVKVEDEKVATKEEKVAPKEEKVAPKEENEEKMEVDEVKVEEVEKKTEKDTADVKILITPPNEEKAKVVDGAEEKVEKKQEMDVAEKVEEAEMKEETVEKTVPKVEVKDEDKTNEESSKSKEEESKQAVEKAEESTEPKVEEKESKDGAPEEKRKEEQPKAEEKAAKDEVSAEKESDVEKKDVSEDVATVENGDAVTEKECESSDAVTENGKGEKDEVRANGVNHENGDGKENGVSSDEKADSNENEAVKAVPKKPELDESVADAAVAQESA